MRLSILLASIFPLGLAAQNLVPNPSFEQVTMCPSFASQLDRAAPWYNPTLGTPELYHGCAPLSSYVSVPINTTGGYQMARTGQAYAGLYMWRADLPEVREYAEVPLTQPLEAGRCYQVAFYANMPNDHPYACDRVGAYFSVGPISATDGFVLPYEAHIEHPAGELITDTVGWTLISGVYTAAGGETHLTIGNFRTDAETQTLQIATGLWYTTSAYLLIDDVSVEPLVLEVDLGPDTLLCSGEGLLLDATTLGATYAWSDGSTGPTLLASDAGTYWVDVSLRGCSASDTIVISGGGPPMLSVPRDASLCPGTSLLVQVATDATEVLWSDGDTSHVRTLEQPGDYAVSASNACGTVTESLRITRDFCPCIPYIPNAFTPNGDGINDALRPAFHCGQGTLAWSVYDRWGHMLFDASDPMAFWDGTSDGGEVPNGVYVWRAEVMDDDLHRAVHYGHVSLLR